VDILSGWFSFAEFRVSLATGLGWCDGHTVRYIRIIIMHLSYSTNSGQADAVDRSNVSAPTPGSGAHLFLFSSK
jgi:hypothetical protein